MVEHLAEKVLSPNKITPCTSRFSRPESVFVESVESELKDK